MPRARGREEIARNTRVAENMAVYAGFVYGTVAHCYLRQGYIGIAEEQMVVEHGPGGRAGRHGVAADNDLRRATAWVVFVT